MSWSCCVIPLMCPLDHTTDSIKDGHVGSRSQTHCSRSQVERGNCRRLLIIERGWMVVAHELRFLGCTIDMFVRPCFLILSIGAETSRAIFLLDLESRVGASMRCDPECILYHQTSKPDFGLRQCTDSQTTTDAVC